MRKTTVADLMSTDVVTLSEETDLLFATAAMKLRKIRHLPVVRGHELVGLISHRDLLRAQARFMAGIKETGETQISSVLAKEVMTTDVQTVSPDTPVDEAAMILVDCKFGCLPVVVEGATLIGILTEADCLRYAVGVLASMNSAH